jgi:hypothetical protein
MKFFLAIILFLNVCLTAQANCGRVLEEIRGMEEKIRLMKRIFEQDPPDVHSPLWAARKISHMVEVDQYVRLRGGAIPAEKNFFSEESASFRAEVHARFGRVDQDNTFDLKHLLKIHGWFSISKFGEKTSHEAWLLAQHADHDLAFQKEVLALLEELYPRGEVKKGNYAYLFDRVAKHENRPQRFGTQGSCQPDGKWKPHPLEDETQLDAQRAAFGLGVFSEYRKQLDTLCQTQKN